jgi:2-polyprenyl-3-methyl-5-hydroxy-6-metoxy-1,4-benzoquinol methylase
LLANFLRNITHSGFSEDKSSALRRRQFRAATASSMAALDPRAREPLLPCKVCGLDSERYGVLDFNKNCLESLGRYLPLIGVPVYYHQCMSCKLVFTAAFDSWGKSEFLAHVYNAEYEFVDPEYRETRPSGSAKVVADFIQQRKDLSVLDYGGGNGVMAQCLTLGGYNAYSWDPMDSESQKPGPRAFSLVSAFEVFEHTPTPRQTFVEAMDFLRDDGVLFFSTLTIDDLPPRSSHFWYISPRNGHVTIYTTRSLDKLAHDHGYKMHHFDDSMHMAYRILPDWLHHSIVVPK